jgi:hypothetical protein
MSVDFELVQLCQLVNWLIMNGQSSTVCRDSRAVPNTVSYKQTRKLSTTYTTVQYIINVIK